MSENVRTTPARAGEPRRGDVVRVRSREEILATLDQDGALASQPFMPEMLQFAGKEMTVWARADKSCDTQQWTGNRRMEQTVHLQGARCDGSAHGGCQAACLLFWREEWLEWPDAPGQPISAPAAVAPSPPPATEATLIAATSAGSDEAYRCQATEHFAASSEMPRPHYLSYFHDVRIRNVTPWVALRGVFFLLITKYQRLTKRFLPSRLRINGGKDAPFVRPTGTGERMPRVDLRPGDLVEIRSKEEIMATLGPDQTNNKLFFDMEMLPYCGRRARVVQKVTRILDENTGKMIKVGDCYSLEDVVCLGWYRMFCRRSITPYWRSGWLRKIDDDGGPSAALPGGLMSNRAFDAVSIPPASSES